MNYEKFSFSNIERAFYVLKIFYSTSFELEGYEYSLILEILKRLNNSKSARRHCQTYEEFSIFSNFV